MNTTKTMNTLKEEKSIADHDNDNVASLEPGNDAANSRKREVQQPKTALSSSLKDARNLLEIEGFAFIPGIRVKAAMSGADIATLVEAARSAPADRYDLTGSRFRRYHQATFFPWCSRVVPNPPFQDGPNLAPYSTYFQAKHFNIEYGNQRRRFAPFSDELLASPALLTLTDICFRLIPRWRLKGEGRCRCWSACISSASKVTGGALRWLPRIMPIKTESLSHS